MTFVTKTRAELLAMYPRRDRKAIQAKNIADRAVLVAARELSLMQWQFVAFAMPVRLPRPVFADELQSRFDTFPPKVVVAKLAALVRRKLLGGCVCGCRGDFTLTDAGRAFLDAGGGS